MVSKGLKLSIASLVALLTVGLFTHRSWPAAVSRPAVKIGFMAPYVGVYAKIGKDMDNGFRLYLERIGYESSGKRERDQTRPQGEGDLSGKRVRRF